MRKIRRRIFGVLVMLAGLALIVCVCFIESYFMIILGTIVLIIGVALWQTADEAGYNESAGGVGKIIDNAGDITIDDIYKSLEDYKSPFGRAWLGGVKLIRSKCIIFGPGYDGSFVYIRKKRGCIYITQCTSDFWLKSKAENPYLDQQVDTGNSTKTPWKFSGDADELTGKLYRRICKQIRS